MGVPTRRSLPLFLLGALLAVGAVEGKRVHGWSGASAMLNTCSGFPPSNKTCQYFRLALFDLVRI